MSSSYFRIFHHLDAPRKYYGATLIEIITVSGSAMTGFVTDKVAIGLVIGALGFKLVRVVSNSAKLIYYQKWAFFHYQDLKLGKSKFSKFLL